MALALLIVAAAAMSAQTTFKPKLAIRPVTTGDIARYKLPSTTQLSGGLTTVGIGEPLYLEVQVDTSIPATTFAGGVTWQLTSKPANSAAVLTDSPLDSSVPVFEPSDRLVAQVAGRKLLKPDVTGPYIVTARVSLGDAGVATVAQTFIAAKYVGVAACKVCHSGGLADPMVAGWSKTGHATWFQQGIDGKLSASYGIGCAPCHTVGYDVNNPVADGGFTNIMKQLNWTFPTTLKPGNFDALPDALKNVANIQCENCHGPGSEHAGNGGDTRQISVPSNAGQCSQCHDAPTHHIKSTEWYSSMHAVTTTHPAGNASCVGCHTGTGFADRMNGKTSTNLAYNPINCFTCHEPHDETAPADNPHLIRAMGPVTLANGTKVTNAGEGLLCMNCHHARQDAATYAASTPGSAYFGPHHGPQGDMIEGTNGYTYGQKIPTSAHQFAVKNTCVTCHMQTVAPTDPGFLKVGGHTFLPMWDEGGVSLVGACQGCHGPDITSFDFPLIDYNNDGVIEGVQTEVQHLLDQLSSMLPPDNKPKDSLNIDSTWTQPQLEAAYNWLFVNNDGSQGIHNTAYAVGLLKASIADLKSKQ